MSLVGVHIPVFSGETGMKLELIQGATLVNSGGDDLTESGSSGYFTATVSETLSGLYRADVKTATGVLVFTDWLYTPSGLVVGAPMPAVSVVVSPTTVAKMDRVSGKVIKSFYKESVSEDIQVVDTDLTPVDLSGKTLRFVISKSTGQVMQSIENGAITRVDDTLGQIRVTWSKAATSIPGTHNWSVRDTQDGDRVLGHGTFIVEQAAYKG